METLPPKIADKILDLIFDENPRSLYELRGVSKTWKDMIDRCTARLLDLWWEKCSDEIPESCLDDFVQARFPQSWQQYCLHKLSMPHIARGIYESRNEFPNLVGNPSFTEICPSPEMEEICSYAVNDRYFAINFSIRQEDETKHALRICSLDDLTCCLREYPIPCTKMDFYATDNRTFIVLHTQDDGSKGSTFLIEFLVNENLIPANLPVNEDNDVITYVITKNECFTISNDSSGFQHQQLTPNGFKPSTSVQIHLPDDSDFRKIMNIQICNSYLFVFVSYRKKNRRYVIVVYKYRMTRQPNGNLIFSDPITYQKKSSAKQLQIYLGSDNIPIWSSICDVYHCKLDKWVKDYFSEQWLKIHSVTIYAHHLLITCDEKVIVFRGSLRQLMGCVAKNGDLGSTSTIIDLKSHNLCTLHSDHARVIRFESEPQFLIVTSYKALIVNFIP